MNLRRVVDQLLGPDGAGVDRVAPDGELDAAVLAADDGVDLDPALAGEALLHFADTAPLAQADALAPIVAEAGPVAFDPDLDPVGSAAAIDDDPALIDTDGDGDPDAFDDGTHTPGDDASDPAAFDEVEPTAESESATIEEAFGSGSADAAPAVVDTPPGDDGGDAVDALGDEPDADMSDVLDPLGSSIADSTSIDELSPDEMEIDGGADDPDLLLDD